MTKCLCERIILRIFDQSKFSRHVSGITAEWLFFLEINLK